MKKLNNERRSERGGAAVKFLLVFVVLALVANAGFNYVPVAYNAASFKQEMDSAVVKALATSGRLKPLDVATASILKASTDHQIPDDAVVEIRPVEGGVIEAHVAYTTPINMLPFGMYRYNYNFDYVARPQGYLLKQ